MTIMERKRGGALDDLPITEPHEVIIPEPRPEKAPKVTKIKASFFLEPEDHALISEICFRRKISQQQVFEAALHGWLQTTGEGGLKKFKDKQ